MLMLSFYLFFLLVSLNLLIERGLNFNLPLIFKDSVTDMHGLSIYVKEGLILKKLCWFLFMFSTGSISFSVLLLFPLLITSLYTRFLRLFGLQ